MKIMPRNKVEIRKYPIVLRLCAGSTSGRKVVKTASPPTKKARGRESNRALVTMAQVPNRNTGIDTTTAMISNESLPGNNGGRKNARSKRSMC